MGWQAMDMFFNPEVLADLTAAVDRQLQEIQTQPIGPSRSGMDEVQALRSQLAMQTAAIAQVTQEPADSFLRKFARVAKRDVCEEGGLLNKQWEAYQDLSRPETLTCVGGALAVMGVANPVVATIVVPITVIMVHLGLRTFCEEYGEKAK
jgi:hypothetical protein